MKDYLIQPAATLAAALLPRLAPTASTLKGQTITDAFLQAYAALEQAENDIGSGRLMKEQIIPKG
jgi:hypothetical protein